MRRCLNKCGSVAVFVSQSEGRQVQARHTQPHAPSLSLSLSVSLFLSLSQGWLNRLLIALELGSVLVSVSRRNEAHSQIVANYQIVAA